MVSKSLVLQDQYPHISYTHAHILELFFNFYFLYFAGLIHIYNYFFYYSFIHMCVHCLGQFSCLSPHTNPLPHNHPRFQAEPVLPLSLILLKRRHKHNKKDKVFLLVDLRLAIQKDF
jgi:hypothetical protein